MTQYKYFKKHFIDEPTINRVLTPGVLVNLRSFNATNDGLVVSSDPTNEVCDTRITQYSSNLIVIQFFHFHPDQHNDHYSFLIYERFLRVFKRSVWSTIIDTINKVVLIPLVKPWTLKLDDEHLQLYNDKGQNIHTYATKRISNYLAPSDSASTSIPGYKYAQRELTPEPPRMLYPVSPRSAHKSILSQSAQTGIFEPDINFTNTETLS
jgi:hypothetical protein